MGTGATALDENFYAATRYEAPAEGFNLTHLYFVGTVGDLENVDIEASVILGNDVTATEKTIGHGKIHIAKEEPREDGSYQGAALLCRIEISCWLQGICHDGNQGWRHGDQSLYGTLEVIGWLGRH